MSAVRPKDITFHDTHFAVGNAHFDYGAVDTIRFEYTAITIKAYGIVSQGTVHHPEFDIHIRNHADPVNVRLAWKFSANPATHTKKKADDLLAAYEELCRRTFETRLQRYLDQIRTNSYFLYDKKRFTEDGRMLSDSGKFILNIPKVRLLRHPFRIECQSDGSIFEKAARMLSKRAYTIKTHYDRDVLFSLFDHLYRIRWS